MEQISIIPCAPDELERYAQVSIRFTSDRLLNVVPIAGGLGGLRLDEVPVDPPIDKDFDDYERPADWPRLFDTTNFRSWLAVDSGQPVGGTTLVWNTPSIHMLEGRSDLAVLWDIRIDPGYRGRGIGRALFSHAAGFARGLGLVQMKIETQNNNIQANRFYQAMGCQLGVIHRYAYFATPEFRDEVMLLWYLDL